MSEPRLRDTWVLRKHEASVFIVIYAAFTAVWFAVGWLLTNPLKGSWIVETDQSISEWFANRRTSRLNSLTFIGSMMSDTLVKIVVTALVAVTMLIVWKRWLEPLIISVALILEALVFITVTTLVGRPRPDVPRLETSPVGSSYPSGHVGAALAYSAIVVVVLWHTRRHWLRVLLIAVGVIIPLCVALARIYRGMHYFSDTILGALLGGASVIAAVTVLRRAADREPAQETEERPAGVEPTPVGSVAPST
jgi:membrane-associated phospholipid phosphatase